MEQGRMVMRVRITGQVQGVGFRAWTKARAEQLGLVGWVRNERDGSVTALIGGPEEAVSKMMQDLWKGPAAASVVDVSSERVEPDELPAGFSTAG